MEMQSKIQMNQVDQAIKVHDARAKMAMNEQAVQQNAVAGEQKLQQNDAIHQQKMEQAKSAQSLSKNTSSGKVTRSTKK